MFEMLEQHSLIFVAIGSLLGTLSTPGPGPGPGPGPESQENSHENESPEGTL